MSSPQGRPNLLGQKRPLILVPLLRVPLGLRSKTSKPCLMRLLVKSLYLHPKLMTPYLLLMKPNWWCIEGQYQGYKDAKMLNEKGIMTRLVKVECRVLIGVCTRSSRCTKCSSYTNSSRWIRDLDTDSEDIVY